MICKENAVLPVSFSKDSVKWKLSAEILLLIMYQRKAAAGYSTILLV